VDTVANGMSCSWYQFRKPKHFRQDWNREDMELARAI
jgi:hypothetical protein